MKRIIEVRLVQAVEDCRAEFHEKIDIKRRLEDQKDLVYDLQKQVIPELQEKLNITISALKKIKMENLDDKTQTRYIKALQDYMSRASKTSWNALKEIGVDPLSK